MYASFDAPNPLDDGLHYQGCQLPDPLDPDTHEDLPLLVTRRRLIRLALVAAETGARFQRDGLDQDPVAWMLAPRELFDGRDGIQAAMDLDGCLRAILLHGLALGLDADPGVIDDLLDDEQSIADPSPLMA